MKIKEEKRELLGDVRVGKEVDHENYRFYFGNEDCHYPGTLISGCKMLEKCIDFATSYYARRENGISNLFVHVDGDILRQVHVSDVMECIVWPVKEGNTSRVCGFEMYKLEEYCKETDVFDVLEEPILTVKGEVTLVLGSIPHA